MTAGLALHAAGLAESLKGRGRGGHRRARSTAAPPARSKAWIAASKEAP
ncbi:MAG: hypothetical protein IPH80_29920 [Myxococcales bacterium]|nr:hypothetical protein [Myxococcales bacterium]